MQYKQLPPNPSLEHLKSQAKQLEIAKVLIEADPSLVTEGQKDYRSFRGRRIRYLLKRIGYLLRSQIDFSFYAPIPPKICVFK